MRSKKIKWLIYTVLVGLIPILSRWIAWLITNEGAVEVVSATDFIAFGLVLHISTINEIEHIPRVDKDWKTIQNGSSIAFISFYSVLFAISLIGGRVINGKSLIICSIVLAVVSFLICCSVYYYLVRTLDRH